MTRLSKAEELYQEGHSGLEYELPEIDICLDEVTKDGKNRISAHISFGLDSTISDQAKANISDRPNWIGSSGSGKPDRANRIEPTGSGQPDWVSTGNRILGS